MEESPKPNADTPEGGDMQQAAETPATSPEPDTPPPAPAETDQPAAQAPEPEPQAPAPETPEPAPAQLKAEEPKAEQPAPAEPKPQAPAPEEKQPAPAPAADLEATDQETPAEETTAEEDMSEFDSLIGDYLEGMGSHEIDSIISVPVVEIGQDHIMVDMGEKAEGIIPIDEFREGDKDLQIAAGDNIDVQVLGRDEETGLIQVSYRKARQKKAWERFEKALGGGDPISGIIRRTVKGGVIVDAGGIEAFMPASQVADRRIAKLEDWIGKEVEVAVLEFDKRKRRAVVSRRKLIEEAQRRAREEILAKINEGDVVQGIVRNVLDFGAFLDIGGVDAFLPRDEISWDRGVSPAKLLDKGQETEVKILQIDNDTGRIRVSRKALHKDPWADADQRYPEGATVRGEVVSLTRYGAFVHIEEGLTGLIHVSDLSWAKSPAKVDEHVKEGDQVQAQVLGVDMEKRRLSLGLKQLVEDPWVEAERQFPKGSKVRGTVTNLTNFGAFVRIADAIEGLIHISDISWEKVKHPGEVLQKGQEVEALVLKTDAQSRRFSLGLKQLSDSPFTAFLRTHKNGDIVEGSIVRMIATGAFVNLAPQVDGFLHVSQMDTERVEKPEDKFKKGDDVRCKITKIEKNSGKVSLSCKALIESEQREVMRQYQDKPENKGGLNLGELLEKIDIEPNNNE